MSEEEKLKEFLKEYIGALSKPLSFRYTNDEKIEMLKQVINLIDNQQKEIEKIKEETEKRNWVHIKENGEVEPLFYISKDKIREKIKEIENSGLRENIKACVCNTLAQLL